jgi:hypothetical protein
LAVLSVIDSIRSQVLARDIPEGLLLLRGVDAAQANPVLLVRTVEDGECVVVGNAHHADPELSIFTEI